MKMHPTDHLDNLDADALQEACATYMLHALNGELIAECMGKAILTYANHASAKRNLKHGLVASEMPLEVLYPDIHDRYIAAQERRRAIGIISECLNEIGPDEFHDISELKLFLALVQGEIEGL